MKAINQLLSTRNDIWLGTKRPYRMALPTGRDDLDQQLPDHGWPCGQIIELLPTPLGSGELSLLLPLLAHQTQQAKPVMLVSPPWIPCPQAMRQSGLCLEHMVIVNAQSHLFWATEQALKVGLCGAVILWLTTKDITATRMRRLQLACENGPAPLFVISSSHAHSQFIRSAVKIQVKPGPVFELLDPKDAPEPYSLGHSPDTSTFKFG